MGGPRGFQSLVIDLDLLATYRVDPTVEGQQDALVVRMARPLTEEMKRTRLSVPASLRVDGDLSIASVLEYALDISAERKKLTRFFGAKTVTQLEASIRR